MKYFKYFAAIAFLFVATLVSAGDLVVTTFLGIPVDGSKSEMRRKLMAKGFIPRNYDGNEAFEGNFNGYAVNVHIVTYKDKVCRICVFDKNTVSASSIKNRFNTLVYQFERNGKYRVSKDYTIPDSVDIAYEMNVNKKRFDALYLQIDLSKKEREVILQDTVNDNDLNGMSDSLKVFWSNYRKSSRELMESMERLEETNRAVWFTISQYGGEYYISMYYDNEYNRPKGEDL
jgi:hypothetical protein